MDEYERMNAAACDIRIGPSPLPSQHRMPTVTPGGSSNSAFVPEEIRINLEDSSPVRSPNGYRENGYDSGFEAASPAQTRHWTLGKDDGWKVIAGKKGRMTPHNASSPLKGRVQNLRPGPVKPKSPSSFHAKNPSIPVSVPSRPARGKQNSDLNTIPKNARTGQAAAKNTFSALAQPQVQDHSGLEQGRPVGAAAGRPSAPLPASAPNSFASSRSDSSASSGKIFGSFEAKPLTTPENTAIAAQPATVHSASELLIDLSDDNDAAQPILKAMDVAINSSSLFDWNDFHNDLAAQSQATSPAKSPLSEMNAGDLRDRGNGMPAHPAADKGKQPSRSTQQESGTRFAQIRGASRSTARLQNPRVQHQHGRPSQNATTAARNNSSGLINRSPINGSTAVSSQRPRPSVNTHFRQTAQFSRIRQRRTMNLVTKPDHYASTAWRNNEVPDAKIQLPHGFSAAFSLGNHNTKEKVMSLNLKTAQIGGETDTHIALHAVGGRIELWVYGQENSVKAAQASIKDWISEIRPPRSADRADKAKWAKISAFQMDKWEEDEAKILLGAEKERYKRVMPPGYEVMKPAAFSKWPAELQPSPQEVLGQNLEVLDMIRVECQTYIFLVADYMHPVFKIVGHDERNVKLAKVRLEGIYDQVRTRAFEPEAIYVLMGLDGGHDADFISMIPYEKVGPIGTQSTEPQMVPSLVEAETDWDLYSADDAGMSADGGQAGHTEERLSENQFLDLQQTISEPLQKLRSLKGIMRLRVRLGVFVLSSYRKDMANGGYPLLEFREMMTDPRCEGFVTKDLGRSEYEACLMSRIVRAGNVLSPLSARTPSLRDVKPTFKGLFVVRSQKANTGHYLLELDFADSDRQYEVVSKKWSRLEFRATETTRLMNANIVDLRHSLAWHFDLRSSVPLTKGSNPKSMDEAANKITINPKAVENIDSPVPFISWPRGVPTFTVQSVRMIRSWRYNITNSMYDVEVEHVITVVQDPNAQDPSVYGSSGYKVMKPYWQVGVIHQEWQSVLSRNQKLAVGRTGRWEDPLEQFFPADGFSYVSPLPPPQPKRSETGSTKGTSARETSSLPDGRPQYQQLMEQPREYTVPSQPCEGLKFLLPKLFAIQEVIQGKNAESPQPISSSAPVKRPAKSRRQNFNDDAGYPCEDPSDSEDSDSDA